MRPKTNVLVTGGSGFVGIGVARRLAIDPSLDVTFASREPLALKQNIPEGSYQVVPLDILDERSWREFDFSRFERLLHMAWGRLDNFNDAQHMDVQLPQHMAFLQEAITNGVRSLTVTGTCLEYGLQNGALAEDFAAAPVTSYGKAKNTLRQLLEQLRVKVSFTLQWIRLFYLHGPGQQKRSLLAQLDAAIERGDSHFDMSNGDQRRDYLPVDMAAEKIVQIFRNRAFEGIVNCCSGTPISVRQLVERHLAERGKRMELRLGVFPYPSYEPFEFWGEDTRLRRVVGPAS